MRFFLKGVLPALALAIPCILAWTAPASAINPPDKRAACDRFGNLNTARSEGALACNRVGTGQYLVTFFSPSGIGSCTVTGTLGVAAFAQDSLTPSAGEIALSFAPPSFVYPFGVAIRTVKVFTFTSGGGAADNGFRILVSC